MIEGEKGLAEQRGESVADRVTRSKAGEERIHSVGDVTLSKVDFLRDRVANIDLLLKQAVDYLRSSRWADREITVIVLEGVQDLNRQIAKEFGIEAVNNGRDA